MLFTFLCGMGYHFVKFGSHIVRFSLGGIPVVGNTATGGLVGLTFAGANLCDALLVREVSPDEITDECAELVTYLESQGAFDELEERLVLQSAYLHVTNTCNLSCVGCYSADANRNRACDPSLSDLEHALDMLAELGVKHLVISGGEPFVRQDLADIARHAKTCGMGEVVVLTNGTLCTKENLAQLAGLADIVSISFDGASPDGPAYIREHQLFDRLIHAVAMVKEAGIHAHILPTLHAKNMQDVPQYFEVAKQLGATVGFSLLSGSSADLGDLMPCDACLCELADQMFSLRQKAAVVSIDDEFDLRRALRVHRVCGAGKTSVSVAADGSLYPCHMLHKPDLLLGNVFVDEVATLAEHIKQFSLPAVDEIAGCSSCEHRYLCGGGCRARSYDERGELGTRDPYCAYYRRSLDKTVEAFVSQVP